MVRSMFAAVAGLRAHQTKMDVIGNNIANVNTYGFKCGRATFKDVFYATLTGASNAGDVYGGGNPSQIGYGSQVGSIDILHTAGGIAPTDNPTDCMIVGNGYFMVGPNKGDGYTLTDGTTDDPNDIKGLNLTRVGIFNFDGSGNLVDPNGNHVYGFMAAEDGTIDENTLIPLRNLNEEGGQRELHSISISKDGTISGVQGTGDSKKPVVIGKLAVANVPNPNALEMGENSYYKARENTGIITANAPGDRSTGQIKGGALEMANVDLSKEFTEMITTQRGFQANTRIITVTDEMLQELVNLKR